MKIRNLNIFIVLSLLIIPLIGFGAARVSANDALRKLADLVGSAESVNCQFVLSTVQGSSKGTLTLSGDKFEISTDGYHTWYDGKTQWTLNEADKEVTISEPTPAELEQINPFAILGSFRRAYDASYSNMTLPGSSTIVMNAKSPKAQVSKVEITVDSKNYMPSKIVIYSDGNQKTTISITSFSKAGKLAADSFRFDSSKYPGTEVNDMR